MKDTITSTDPISAQTRIGIYRLKSALATGDTKSAEEILNGKKYDRPVQFEDKELVDKAIINSAKNSRITVMTLDQFVEENFPGKAKNQ